MAESGGDAHPGGVPELREPLDPDLRRTLRRAVLDHALSERRPRYRPLLHVGLPGAPHPVVPAVAEAPEAAYDQAVRVDVLAALLARAGSSPAGSSPVVWLTRCGERSVQDLDVAWLAAARTACAEADVDLTMVIVDRHGWRDPRTGVQTHWRRLRQR